MITDLTVLMFLLYFLDFVDEFTQVNVSQKMMSSSCFTSTKHHARDVEPILRTIPTVSVALSRHPMASGSRDCGKRWPTRSLSLDLTRAKR